MHLLQPIIPFTWEFTQTIYCFNNQQLTFYSSKNCHLFSMTSQEVLEVYCMQLNVIFGPCLYPSYVVWLHFVLILDDNCPRFITFVICLSKNITAEHSISIDILCICRLFHQCQLMVKSVLLDLASINMNNTDMLRVSLSTKILSFIFRTTNRLQSYFALYLHQHTRCNKCICYFNIQHLCCVC